MHMRARSTLAAGLLAGMLLAACRAAPGAGPGATPAPGSLTVFAAASTSAAFEEIAAGFRAQNPGVEVAFNFAGSNQLAHQLALGAPADVFASADEAQMRAAEGAGRIAPGASQVFANNRLAVAYAVNSPASPHSLKDLARPGLRLVLASEAVPIGRYSLELLERASSMPGYDADFHEQVLANVVSYEENVRLVLGKVSLGEADAGIVYATDVAGPSARVGRLEIPDQLNVTARYPIAPIADSANPAMAQSFVDYVLSPEGQTVLERYGFVQVR
jgi:molybdate transport system substrate-binding protein